jgi:hypothetical protein
VSNYAVWTVQELGVRIVEWRTRLQHAKTREELLSIWGEIEKMAAEFDRAVFEERTSAVALRVASDEGQNG